MHKEVESNEATRNNVHNRQKDKDPSSGAGKLCIKEVGKKTKSVVIASVQQ